MVVDDVEIVVVKEWFLNEVKFDRYVDKFVLNGFMFFEICCSIDENVFDDIGIVLLYYWR